MTLPAELIRTASRVGLPSPLRVVAAAAWVAAVLAIPSPSARAQERDATPLPAPRAAGAVVVSGAARDAAPAPRRRPQSLYEKKILPEKKFDLNDLVLILVDENGSASNNSTTNLRRKYDLKAELSKWAQLDLQDLTLSPDTTNLPSLDFKSEKKLEGRGTTDRRERITFRIMARVVDIRPNGNLVIEGRTSRRINDEESVLTIFGEVDPKDIDERTRAVRSERIADMKLAYSGRGPVSRNLGRSFLSWVLEWLWPF